MRTLHSILLLIFTITTSAHAQPRGIIDEQTLDEQVQDASTELIGTWQGLLSDTGLRILFRFERTAGGAMRVLLNSPDEGTGTKPQSAFRLDGQSLHLEFDAVDVSFDGQVLPTGSDLDGVLTVSSGRTFSLPMKRVDPGTIPYFLPRIKTNGDQEFEFNYQAPEQVEGDWPVGMLSPASKPELVDVLERVLDQSLVGIESVLIAKNGNLIVEEYFYGFDRDEAHQCRSVTKSVGSLLIGIALDQRLIPGVETPIAELFPEHAKEHQWSDRKRSMQLKPVLSMSCGLEGDDLKDQFTVARATEASADWVDYALSLPMVETPGEHFAYSGGSLMILSGALQRAVGMSVQEFARKNLFGPLGIKEPQWFSSPAGLPYFSSGLRLTPRDLAKLGQLCLDKGQWQGKQIVSEEWVSESTRARFEVPSYGYSYGYLWWSTELHDESGNSLDVFMALGYGGQHIFVVPERSLVVVITSGNYHLRTTKVGRQGIVMLSEFLDFAEAD